MTFRTFDIDAGKANATSATAPARHTRRRRHASVMSHRSTGCRIAGFGI